MVVFGRFEDVHDLLAREASDGVVVNARETVRWVTLPAGAAYVICGEAQGCAGACRANLKGATGKGLRGGAESQSASQ